jgi:hypothetical protein
LDAHVVLTVDMEVDFDGDGDVNLSAQAWFEPGT